MWIYATSNQISKSPPEKPLVAIRPAGSSAPIKMEDVKTERVMLSGDGSVESPVEQPFIQRKQKYSSPLCQGRQIEIIACDCLFVCFSVCGMAR